MPAPTPAASPDADTAEILARAAARLAVEPGQPRPYAGAVTPAEAHALLGKPGVAFVDVRTPEEFKYVGHVPGSRLIAWLGTTEDQVSRFLAALRAEVPPEHVVLLLCRSSVRSVRAAIAATQAGYPQAYNILEGFEGKPDANKQRGHLDGWRKAGLPWQQD